MHNDQATRRRRRTHTVGALGALTMAAAMLLPATASAINYRPASIVFPNQQTGQASNPVQVDVGASPCGDPIMPGFTCFFEMTDIAVSGPFTIVGNSCATYIQNPGLSPRYTCSVAVDFRPTTTGAQSGFLRIASSPSIVGVPLSGAGISNPVPPVCKKKGKKKRAARNWVARQRRRKRRSSCPSSRRFRLRSSPPSIPPIRRRQWPLGALRSDPGRRRRRFRPGFQGARHGRRRDRRLRSALAPAPAAVALLRLARKSPATRRDHT